MQPKYNNMLCTYGFVSLGRGDRGSYANATGVGCKLDTITYKNVLDGLLKVSKENDMALSILNEMREKGCIRETTTCNALMGWLVKEGEIEATMQNM